MPRRSFSPGNSAEAAAVGSILVYAGSGAPASGIKIVSAIIAKIAPKVISEKPSKGRASSYIAGTSSAGALLEFRWTHILS